LILRQENGDWRREQCARLVSGRRGSNLRLRDRHRLFLAFLHHSRRYPRLAGLPDLSVRPFNARIYKPFPLLSYYHAPCVTCALPAASYSCPLPGGLPCPGSSPARSLSGSWCFRLRRRPGTAACAAGPIRPSAAGAAVRILQLRDPLADRLALVGRLLRLVCLQGWSRGRGGTGTPRRVKTSCLNEPCPLFFYSFRMHPVTPALELMPLSN
jgi:hypothetical protein